MSHEISFGCCCLASLRFASLRFASLSLFRTHPRQRSDHTAPARQGKPAQRPSSVLTPPPLAFSILAPHRPPHRTVLLSAYSANSPTHSVTMATATTPATAATAADVAVERPNVATILAHPAYPDTIWNLTPTRSGQLEVARGRGGPFKIDWEVHGRGDIKLVWIMGLGSVKTAWQRQTLKFGHDEGDKYSSLIFDNRGMGKSDKPLMRYSTSEMAKDILEILDHLGWTAERELHVSGVSMGGMIAQELAYAVPTRIASLNLLSTAAVIENTTTFVENMTTRIRMFLPKTLDRSVSDAAFMLFSDEWLARPDDTIVPTASTPNVVLPPSGKYGMFTTNYERFAAQEISKRLDVEGFTRKGFMLQAVAAGWHHKSAAQLKELGDKVGRERIMVLHGTKDNMISVPHGRKLIEMLQPGVGIIKEGTGHVFMLEEWKWHNERIEEMVAKAEKLKTA